MDEQSTKQKRKYVNSVDYANGKIYMLEPTCEYEEGDIYYGSCATALHRRFSQHKSKKTNKKRTSLKKIKKTI